MLKSRERGHHAILAGDGFSIAGQQDDSFDIDFVGQIFVQRNDNLIQSLMLFSILVHVFSGVSRRQLHFVFFGIIDFEAKADLRV